MSSEVEKTWPLFGYAPGNYLCTCVVCGQEFQGDKRAVNCLECVARAANKLRAASPSIGRVGVKALEWRNVDSPDMASGDWWFEAYSPFGNYTITFVERHTLPWLLEPFFSDLDSNYASEDQAKAAAQQDYESRIRSTLVCHEEPAGDTQGALRIADETQCATDGCGRRATSRFESGGIGSDYCAECAAKVAALVSPPDAGAVR